MTCPAKTWKINLTVRVGADDVYRMAKTSLDNRSIYTGEVGGVMLDEFQRTAAVADDNQSSVVPNPSPLTRIRWSRNNAGNTNDLRHF